MRDSGRCPDASSLNFALGRRVFRPDIFEKACELSRQGREQHKENPSPKEPLRPSRSLREATECK